MQIRKYAILGLFAAILLYVPSSGYANAESVPNWVKTNAGWWASGDIDQQSFIQGIEYLVNQGIISVPVQKVSGEKSETVPDWIKNTAGWWAEDAISDAAKTQLFELNDEFTRASFKNIVEPFLRSVQSRRNY